MRVIPIAHTLIDWDALKSVIPGTKFAEEAPNEYDTVGDLDHLAEFAGRACYKAWNRGRAATATTPGYLAHILNENHVSVMEHGSVTFWVEGVSRALLVELERHRFLSFSVESQRYVDQASSHPQPVIPPAFAAEAASGPYVDLLGHYADSLNHYDRAVSYFTAKGYGIKRAREAARAFLPNATPVDMVVTGNLRCWRDVLGKRYHPAADREIYEFAALVLGHLRELAPYSVQDFPVTAGV